MNTSILNLLFRIREQVYQRQPDLTPGQAGEDEHLRFGRMVDNYKKLSNLLLLIFKKNKEEKDRGVLFDEIIEEITGKIKSYIPEQPDFKPLEPFRFLEKNTCVGGSLGIIILNENGAAALERIFNAFADGRSGRDLRIILADRASTDHSLELAESYKEKLPLDILAFPERFSRSYILNAAAEFCGTDYLLFIDHMMEFDTGIGESFIRLHGQAPDAGILGAGIIRNNDLSAITGGVRFGFAKPAGVPDIPYPAINTTLLTRCGIDHLLPWYRKEGAVFVRPGLSLPCLQPVTSVLADPGPGTVPAVAETALFCKRSDFIAAGGFDLNYIDGFEDIDLCLSFAAKLGKSTVISRDVGITYPDEQTAKKEMKKNDPVRLYNLGVLINRHGRFLKKKYREDIREGAKFWTEDHAGRFKMPDKLSFAIKSPAFDNEQTLSWGDYHFALSLKKALNKLGYPARVDLHNYWYDNGYMTDDVVIVLRGTKRYHTRRSQINILWNISHPEQVSDEEYRDYDCVFNASTGYSGHLKEKYPDIHVEDLLQCTDAELFHPEPTGPENSSVPELLFVGNSRNVLRTSVANCIRKGLPVAIYGTGWENLVPEALIHGEYIPNEELRKYYSGCKILLNDHWPAMAENGYISNRIFDALACGAIVLSDKVKGIERIFDNGIWYFSNPDEMAERIKWIRYHFGEAKKQALEMAERVLRNHTFDQRAERIAAVAERIYKDIP